VDGVRVWISVLLHLLVYRIHFGVKNHVGLLLIAHPILFWERKVKREIVLFQTLFLIFPMVIKVLTLAMSRLYT